MYFVIHKFQSLLRVAIHLGTHEHLVVEGMCKQSLEEIKVLVEGQVSCTLDAKCFAITLNGSKSFLAHHLFNENGKGPMEILPGEKLDKVMEKFQPLCSFNIQNLIASFKHNASTRSPVDNILFLKSKSPYDYIQDNCFHGQMVGQKMFLFKMSLYGLASWVDLVKCMQPSGDLQNCWLMFDLVKHVQEWTTMACHIYDPMYYKVFTIAICNMQFKSIEAQCVMRTKLNHMMLRFGFANPNFKGFMADNVKANQYVVRIMYDLKNAYGKMVDKE